MSEKRRKLETPILRGVSIGALARVSDFYERNPESLQEQSNSRDAHKHRERREHDRLRKEWNSRAVRLKCRAPGQTIEWQLPNASNLFMWHFEHNPVFRDAVVNVVKTRHNMPLRLIVYCDEITPGNPLAPETRRKCCVWFLSLMEFSHALWQESLWIPIATLLSYKMKKLSGTCSQAHRVVSEAILSDELGICTAGITLVIDGVPTLVTATLLDPICDELGIKSIYDIKGASGLKPCIKCTNIFLKGHRLSRLPGNVDITCFDKAEFSPMTKEDLYDASDRLQEAVRGGVSKSKLKQLQTQCGVNYSPDGVLQSAVLRNKTDPTRSRFDRMHVFESDGISSQEVDLLIQSLAGCEKFSNKQVSDFCNAGWLSRDNAKIRVSIRDNALKGAASDVLAAIPILFHFVCSCLQDWEEDKVESFKALFSVTAQLQKMKWSQNCSADECRKLAELIATHCETFQKAYGSDRIRPKHHMAFHLPDQYENDECYVDCFAMERHLKLIKACVEIMVNHSQKDFEFYVLSKTNRVMAEEAKAWMEQPTAEREVLVNGVIAKSVQWLKSSRGHVGTGSVILLDAAPHLVSACVDINGEWTLVLERLRKCRDVHAHASEWQRLPVDARSHLTWRVTEACQC